MISTQNVYVNQTILKLTKNVDSINRRTLNIITKLDILHESSKSETTFVNFAKNENVEFRLKWHILRNKNYRSKDNIMKKRNRVEKKIFSHDV